MNEIYLSTSIAKEIQYCSFWYQIKFDLFFLDGWTSIRVCVNIVIRTWYQSRLEYLVVQCILWYFNVRRNLLYVCNKILERYSTIYIYSHCQMETIVCFKYQNYQSAFVVFPKISNNTYSYKSYDWFFEAIYCLYFILI